jgi:threonine dehydrogenase-like Zn-dependent dehydrogenase
VRVPYADNAPIKIPASMTDEQALFLGDIFPTGWQAAAQADIQGGDTVAVWGCGPVAQFAMRAAKLLGAERVIAIDEVPERLEMARAGGAETLDFSEVDVLEALNDMTGGAGPDRCIEAVGMEAHGHGVATNAYDYVAQAVKMESDRPIALREAIMACKPGGVVSIPGVFGGLSNAVPLGAAFQKSLTFRMGQTHVNRWADDLLRRIEKGEIDPSFVITHKGRLEDGPAYYRTFRDKEEGCIKVVLQP